MLIRVLLIYFDLCPQLIIIIDERHCAVLKAWIIPSYLFVYLFFLYILFTYFKDFF